MLIIPTDIDLAAIADSGQCFRWKKDENGWLVEAAGNKARLSYDGHNILIDGDGEEAFWKRYLDLDRNYQDIRNKLMKVSPMMSAMVKVSPGLHILNQPFFEMSISAIVSQNNNIPRISKILDNMCDDGYFPEAATLQVKLKDNDFGLGYRKRYVEQFCQDYISGKYEKLEAIAPLGNFDNVEKAQQMAYEEADALLRSGVGIGPKVAACIELFSLGYINAIPRDVWIKRAEEQYGVEWQDDIAGIQQQYVFRAIRLELV